jgi:hypothetical protein
MLFEAGDDYSEVFEFFGELFNEISLSVQPFVEFRDIYPI